MRRVTQTDVDSVASNHFAHICSLIRRLTDLVTHSLTPDHTIDVKVFLVNMLIRL